MDDILNFHGKTKIHQKGQHDTSYFLCPGRPVNNNTRIRLTSPIVKKKKAREESEHTRCAMYRNALHTHETGVRPARVTFWDLPVNKDKQTNKHMNGGFPHLLKLRALVEPQLGRLVEGGEIRDVGGVREEIGVRLLHVVDEHAELGSPVADVVMSEHLQICQRNLCP